MFDRLPDLVVYWLFIHSYEILTASLLALSGLGVIYIVLKALRDYKGSKWVRRTH